MSRGVSCSTAVVLAREGKVDWETMEEGKSAREARKRKATRERAKSSGGLQNKISRQVRPRGGESKRAHQFDAPTPATTRTQHCEIEGCVCGSKDWLYGILQGTGRIRQRTMRVLKLGMRPVHMGQMQQPPPLIDQPAA